MSESIQEAGRARHLERNRVWLARLLDRAPARRPSQLTGRSWWGAIKRTVREFLGDSLTDRAAALTFYSIQSLFPGLVVLIAGLGLLGRSTTQSVVDNVNEIAPGAVGDIMVRSLNDLQENQGAAGALAILGLVVAFWSASGYIGAFIRAANAIYDVPEGRPMWKTLPLRIAITALTGTMLAASVLTVVFTGRLAEWAGGLIGIGPEAVGTWDILKWPVLVVAIGLLFAVLYWAAPNARHPGFRWVTPGSMLAVVVWIALSGGFAYYVSNFNSYNRIYGALGGVIIFLVWLWLSNVALLLGAEFDAELSRSRAIEAGYPPDAEPYVTLRQAPKVPAPPESDAG